MPGLNRSESRNDNVDAIASSGSEPLASASSNESRGRTKDRDPIRRLDAGNHSKAVKRCVVVQHYLLGYNFEFSPFYDSGYHVFTAFGKEFCVEQRWKFLRELGSGAYGYVVCVIGGFV